RRHSRGDERRRRRVVTIWHHRCGHARIAPTTVVAHPGGEVPMIPASFDYVRAETPDHAVQLLQEHGDDAKLLAGGHSLLPLMKLRLATPSVLVDVGRLTDLSYVRDGGDHVAVGALTRHRDLETSALLIADAPILAHAAGHVGDPQVRHRG